jgi:hypothetical protein
VRVLGPGEGARVVELCRGAMITRQRDLDAFAYGDARDVRIVDDGHGLAFALVGVVPERRTLLAAIYGALTLQNGVPVGYSQLDVIAGTAAVSFNTFQTFAAARRPTRLPGCSPWRGTFSAPPRTASSRISSGKATRRASSPGRGGSTTRWASARVRRRRGGSRGASSRACRRTHAIDRHRRRCAGSRRGTCSSISTRRARAACRR